MAYSETDSSFIESLPAQLVVGVRRNKDQRNIHAPCLKRPLQLQPAHSRHLHVRNDAGGVNELGRVQEVTAGFKCVSGKIHGSRNALNRDAHRSVIINDANYR